MRKSRGKHIGEHSLSHAAPSALYFSVQCKAMAEATLSAKNQIVVPREARDALGAKPGDKLLITVRGDTVIILRKPKSYRKALSGVGGTYPAGYVDKERQSWD